MSDIVPDFPETSNISVLGDTLDCNEKFPDSSKLAQIWALCGSVDTQQTIGACIILWVGKIQRIAYAKWWKTGLVGKILCQVLVFGLSLHTIYYLKENFSKTTIPLKIPPGDTYLIAAKKSIISPVDPLFKKGLK